MKLKHLVAELEGVRTWEKPKVALEQYPTSCRPLRRSLRTCSSDVISRPSG